MTVMSVKFLLTICLTGTFGQMVRNQPDPGNPAPQWQDLDVGDPPQQWQDLVTLVYGKIEGMERLLAQKDKRIDQLEHTLLQKDDVMDKLATRVSDLETIMMFESSEHESRRIARSHLPKTENNGTQVLGKPSDSRSGSSVWKMSTPQSSIPQTSTYQNGSIMPTHSKQHIENDDDHLLNQSDQGDTATHTENGAEDLSIATFSRFQQKRVTPRTTVAFHVAISENKDVTENDVVVYDHETLDQGDGYNPVDGLYITPESGTYVITWTSLCYTHNYLQTVLVVNGVVRGSSWADTRSPETYVYHQATAVVVLTLNQGDHVFIRTGHTYGHGTLLYNSDIGISTLSGWKLD